MDNNDNGILLFIVLVLILGAVVFIRGREKFSGTCKRYDPGDISHCPKKCSPFLYPDMYSPHTSCSDPFNWGFTYSTGRCPRAYSPVPRRLPSPPGEKFNNAPWFTHGGGASYDDPKHTQSSDYAYDYDYA